MPSPIRVLLACALALCGCVPRQGGPGTPLRGEPRTFSYTCDPMLMLRVRFDATSASVTADGDGPYVLPQVSGRSDFTVYSDGQHVLQIAQGITSYGVGRGRLRECLRG